MSKLTEYTESTQLSPTVGPIRSFPKRLESDSEIFIFPLLRTIKRRIKLVLATFLGILLLGTLAYLMWPTRYESTAELSYSFDSADMIQLSDESLGSLGSNDSDTKLATQVTILKNRDLMLDVIAKLDLARNPQFYRYARPDLDSGNLNPLDQYRILRAFGRRLSVKVVPRTYLVEIAFRNTSPQLAQRVLAQLLSEYVQRTFEARYLDTKQSADWLQKQVDGLRQDVEMKEHQLVALQEQKGILLIQPPNSTGGEQQGAVGTTESVRLGEVIKAQVAGQADRIDKEARYRASLSGDPEMLASIVPQSKIVALRQEQVALDGRLASLTSQFGPNYPDVVSTRAQLKSVDESVRKEVGNLQEQLREEYVAAQHGEQLMQQTADATKAEAFKQIGAAAELIALQEEVDSGQRLYEDLERKLKESGVLAGLKSTQTDIVVRPNVAARPVEPSLLMFAGIALFFGTVGSISAAVLRENSDRTLKNAYEVEEAIQIPVLGQIPHQSPAAQDSEHLLPNSVMKSLLRGGPKSRVAEAFRTLVSSLLLSSTRVPKIILVTSSLPGEGKTSVSVGVATILSQKRARVLLIEADMRRPTMHRSLLPINSTKGRAGLATVLSGSSTLDDSVYRVEALPGLTILPSGPIPPYPAELLDSEVMANVLSHAREEFDYVVIDTPPLLSVSDALPLTALADAVLVVVRSRNTRLHALVDTHNVVVRTGARISGVVLNDVADLDGGHYYYGYYNSYYEESANRLME